MSLDGEATDTPITVKAAARFLGVSPSLVYAYVERRQIPHYRMMGRSIRFRLSELVEWRQQFHVNGGIDEQQDRVDPEIHRVASTAGAIHASGG